MSENDTDACRRTDNGTDAALPPVLPLLARLRARPRSHLLDAPDARLRVPRQRQKAGADRDRQPAKYF